MLHKKPIAKLYRKVCTQIRKVITKPTRTFLPDNNYMKNACNQPDRKNIIMNAPTNNELFSDSKCGVSGGKRPFLSNVCFVLLV